MLTFYRGHWMLLVREKRRWWCEITERSTAEILPTGTSADLDEGFLVCAERARALIDGYVGHAPPEVRITCIPSAHAG